MSKNVEQHECKENGTLRRIGEWKLYKENDGYWWISSDDGCDHTTVNYCPFCGKKLE